MATVDERRGVTRPAPRQPAFTWLGALGFVLVLALLASALLQVRQYASLRQPSRQGADLALLSVHQLEADHLRLRQQWRQAADDRVPLDAQALRLAYGGWARQVRQLAAHPPDAPTLHDALQRALGPAQAFVADADRAFGAGAQSMPDRSLVTHLRPELEALGAPLQELAASATRSALEQLEQRSQAVREQNQLGLGLTLFLSLLTLVFAAVALRQVRELRARRAALETLASNLRQARHEAEATSEAKSAFLAHMSHEIRTPFHALMGMLSLLRESGLTPRQIDHLRTATESADHLLAILNDILDMSQLEGGRLSLSPAAVELRPLLREVEALMRPQAAAKALALHVDAAPGVPEHILADSTRVKQIVVNLLSNAIKFSDHGAVMLDIRPCSGAQGKSELEFVVTDSGIGMDEAHLARLFDRYAQGDGSRLRRHGGTGLGLEISRSLARLMGGDIGVRSKPGSGSSFTFRMPLQALPAPPASAGNAAHGAQLPWRPLQVLVAEDHPVNREYIAALLESMGHRAHFTTNGLQAVQAAREQHFDLVLMDLYMPELDGVAATRAIRALPDPARSTVPIVALTADAYDETRQRCLVAGMNDFLTKPVSPQKLATSLRRLFGSSAGAAPAPPPAVPPPAHGSSQPLVDQAALSIALQAMPRARLVELITAFLDQGTQTVQRLRTAVRDAQPLELRVHAHAAKGTALNLGLAALAATAEALQEGASTLPAHEIARLVQRYEELLPATREVVRGLGLLALPADITR
jgi:hypothetical protein